MISDQVHGQDPGAKHQDGERDLQASSNRRNIMTVELMIGDYCDKVVLCLFLADSIEHIDWEALVEGQTDGEYYNEPQE